MLKKKKLITLDYNYLITLEYINVYIQINWQLNFLNYF